MKARNDKFFLDLANRNGRFPSVLDNDSARNGISSVEILTPPKVGTLKFRAKHNEDADGSFLFRGLDQFRSLAEGDTRWVSFKYRVTDTDGDSDKALARIRITGENDAPTLSKAVRTIGEDKAQVKFNLARLGSDPDRGENGRTLTYSIVEDPELGTAAIRNGKLVFRPGDDFQFLDRGETERVTIRVRATDEHGKSAVTDMVVKVEGEDDPTHVVGLISGKMYGDGDKDVVGSELFGITSFGEVVLLANLAPGAQSSFPGNFIQDEGRVIFATGLPNFPSVRSWHAIDERGNISDIPDLTDLDSDGYFSFPPPAKQWGKLFGTTSDGIVSLSGKTAEVFYSGTGWSIHDSEVTAFGQKLVFAEGANPSQLKLKFLDEDGDVSVVSGNYRVVGPQPTDFYSTSAVLGPRYYFVGENEPSGRELFWTNKTGVARALDLEPGGFGSNPDGLTRIGNKIYFAADDGLAGREVHVLHGKGRVDVVDVLDGIEGSNPHDFTAFRGSVYFWAETKDGGEELHRLNKAGKVKVFDAIEGQNSSRSGHTDLVKFDNKLVFYSWDHETHDYKFVAVSPKGKMTSFAEDMFDRDTFLSGNFEPTVVNGDLYFGTGNRTDNEWSDWKMGSIRDNPTMVAVADYRLQAEEIVELAEPWLLT